MWLLGDVFVVVCRTKMTVISL